MKTYLRHPPIRAYMDNLTVTTTSVIGSRWTLRSLEKLIAWARMKFKPSLWWRNGKDNFRFLRSRTTIPTMSECPVKSLGKTFNSSLRDTNAFRATVSDLGLWLARIDKSGLPDRFKTWVHHYAVLPRILWSLFVYDFPITIVEAMKRKINRWLPRSLSSTVFYSTATPI